MARFGRADEVGELRVECGGERFPLWCELIDVGLRCFARSFGGLRNLLSVFVGAGEGARVAVPRPRGARENVRRNRRVGVADVRGG